MKRRSFLAWVGAAPGWALLGCSGGVDAGADSAGGAAGAPGSGPDASTSDAMPESALNESGTDATVAEAGAGPDGSSCPATRPDALGPFHEPGAPERTVLAGPEEPGERIVIRGRVLQTDCSTPIPGAIVDVWHADASGEYHSSSESWRLRAQMKTDQQGRYAFESILPGNYAGRPRHIHYMVTAPGFAPLVTQLYFEGDPFLGPNDSCQLPTCDSNDPSRIIPLGQSDPLAGSFDVVLSAA